MHFAGKLTVSNRGQLSLSMKGQEGKHFRLHDHLVRKAVSQLCYYATKAEETTHK